VESDIAVHSSGNGTPAKRHPQAKPLRLNVEQQAAQAKAESEADIIEHAVFAASMASSVAVGNGVTASGFKRYLDRLLEQSGNPTDPIERMMIQQVALAHFRIAQLHARADKAKTVDAAKQYTAVAIRLTGELRRMGLAIQRYRQPPKKKFVVVQQQNLSAGDQQIAYLDKSDAESGLDKVSSLPGEHELGSKRLTNDATPGLTAESETDCCWSTQPEEARSIDANGPRAAARSGFAEPALGALDRAKDR